MLVKGRVKVFKEGQEDKKLQAHRRREQFFAMEKKWE